MFSTYPKQCGNETAAAAVRCSMARSAVAAALVLMSLMPLLGQSALEVASVTRNVSGPTAPRNVAMRAGGTMVVTNFNVRPLVQMAYRVQRSQLVGGPDWLDTELYDILAKHASATATVDTFSETLRAVLEERFKLRTHREQRELPVYAFVMARPDRALGPGLRPVEYGCGPLPPGQLTAAPCSMSNPPGRVAARGAPIPMLAFALGGQFDRPVVDRTGLTGYFDVTLEYTPDTAAGTGASLVTALQEQLGLRVQPDRATVDVVVIDAIEKPAEN
jgi:uncharacterized protein (TIGR03435 family)